MDKLIQLSEEWLIRKVADHEYEKARIAEIFERINEARVQFEVCAASYFRISRLISLVYLAGNRY